MRRATKTTFAVADLVWFFSRGVTLFQRSTAGAMWENAWLFSTNEKPVGDVMAVKSSHHYDRDPPNEAAAIEAGRIRGRLNAISALDPQAARALANAYGEPGAKWSHHKRGSIVALFPLVESGRELVARARRQSRNRLELSDADRLRIEVEVDAITNGRDALRRQLITRATGEAEELLTRALRLWCTGGGR